MELAREAGYERLGILIRLDSLRSAFKYVFVLYELRAAGRRAVRGYFGNASYGI